MTSKKGWELTQELGDSSKDRALREWVQHVEGVLERVDRRTQIARTLRNARARAGFSQSEVQSKTGITPPQLSRYENGIFIPRSATAARLAAAYGIQVEDIFGEDG